MKRIIASAVMTNGDNFIGGSNALKKRIAQISNIRATRDCFPPRRLGMTKERVTARRLSGT
jgi:hypothetical protein